MAAQRGRIRVNLDLEPLHLRAALQARARVILEGGTGFGNAGRWSFYGFEPRQTISGRHPAGLPLSALETAIAPSPEAIDRDPEGPPFLGGWIGYFAYDLGRSFERLPSRARRTSDLPDFHFERYSLIAIVEETTGRAEIVATDDRDEGPSLVQARVDALRRILQKPFESSPGSRLRSPIVSNFTRDHYMETVERALDYIRAGDIFQVNLSQRFEAEGRFEPLDLYRRLSARSPAPYSALLPVGMDSFVISASPELFYETRGDQIVTRPIKGTRPRGITSAEDLAFVEELRSSAKDHAELTMIVDLERNDLGRFCEYGSVKVTEPGRVETFAQVHHRVATVEGRIRAGIGRIDVLRAMFPGGSITGAPKIRSMEIIDELEPTRRGVYTGAIGYFDDSGNSAFNIAIRTMILEGGRVSFQVGGGIVADSKPEAEYEETLHKGRAMREVLEELAP